MNITTCKKFSAEYINLPMVGEAYFYKTAQAS